MLCNNALMDGSVEPVVKYLLISPRIRPDRESPLNLAHHLFRAADGG